MALPEEDIAVGALGHIDHHESLHALHNQFFSPLDPQYYATGQKPGEGNVTHDMTAITNMLADIMSGTPISNRKEKVAHFPGGRDWHLNGAGIDWPNGVHMICGNGSATGVGRPTQFLWDGTAGGTMFNLTATSGGRVANTLIQEAYFREGTARPGKWFEIGDETLPAFAGVDMGTVFRRCFFANADAPSGAGCFDIRFGPTNMWVDLCRFDNWSGAGVRIAVNNAGSHVTFSRGTMDNGPTLGGFPFWLDNTGGGSNKNLFFTADDWKIEINSALPGEKAIILCSIDHLSTVTVQHHVRLNDFHVVPGGTGGTDYSVVGARRTDAAETRNIHVEATNTQLPFCRRIDGVVDEGEYGSFVGRTPNWSYTVQGHGHANPGGEASLNDFQTQERVRDLIIGNGSLTNLMGTNLGRGMLKFHNALAAPSANPTDGALVYSDPTTDDLRVRTPSGNIVILPNTKPTVSGSRGANAALADLLTELATLGLITDSTTA